MNWLTIIWSMAAGTAFVLALTHLFMWAQQHRSCVPLLFAVLAVGSGANTLFELELMHCPSPEVCIELYRWSHIAIYMLLVGLVWFVYKQFGTARRWLAIVITAIWTVALMINFASPHSLLFTDLPEMRLMDTWLGESFTMAVGAANPWRFALDITSLLILAYLADASWRLWRQGGRRRAVLVGGSSIIFMITAGIHTPLVDAGIISTPYMASLAFMAIVLAISFDLSYDVVRVGKLSLKVHEHEARWLKTMEGIQFAVADVNAQGIIQYANPFLMNLMGAKHDELIGLNVSEIVSPDEEETQRREMQKALAEGTRPYVELTMLYRSGKPHIIRWSSVKFTNSSGLPNGFLKIGADMTDQRQVEAERDHAIQELARSRELLEQENLLLRKEIGLSEDGLGMVGQSDALKYVLFKIEQVAETDATVLIEGETGVGKDLVAKAIHQASNRSGKPFVKVNCAALPEHLVESELFGHEKGAFTGANFHRAGRFEEADGGTLLLDEIGELPGPMQAKLLHVLQDNTFERVGGATMKVDVRVIAATNRDLAKDIASGRFRMDLYYRLNVYPITIPPLRQRRGDIRILVSHFVNDAAFRMDRSITEIPVHVMEVFEGYSWPGNIRELKNAVERAVIASADKVLQMPDFLPIAGKGQMYSIPAGTSPHQTLEEVERQHIAQVLDSVAWRISGKGGAADLLGLKPSTLRFRMKKLGIHRE